ncbi:short-chain dehydrogenase, partial [Bordetella pertussis]
MACIAGSGTERGRAIAARLADEGWKVVQLDGPDGQDARAASPALGIDLGAAADIATIAARLGVDYDEVGAYIHCA